MKQIYSGMISDCNFILPDKNLKWLRSEKKKKYYAKIDNGENLYIYFKNGYLIIFDKGKKKHIEPLRNYYHKIINGKVIKVENDGTIPF